MPTYFNYGDYPDWQQAMGYIAGQPLRAESPDQTTADASAQLAFLPVPEPLGAVARLRQLDASHVQCAQHEDPQLDYPPAQLAHPESLRSLPKVARDPFYNFEATTKGYASVTWLLAQVCDSYLREQLVNFCRHDSKRGCLAFCQHDRLRACLTLFADRLQREQRRIDQQLTQLGISQGSLVQLQKVASFSRHIDQYNLATLQESSLHLRLEDFGDRFYILNPPQRWPVQNAIGPAGSAELRALLRQVLQECHTALTSASPIVLGRTVEYVFRTGWRTLPYVTGPVVAAWQLALDGEQIICWATHGPSFMTHVYALRPI